MELTHLPHRALLADYERQVASLRAAHAASAEEVAGTPFSLATRARGYDFADWSALTEWVGAVARGGG